MNLEKFEKKNSDLYVSSAGPIEEDKNGRRLSRKLCYELITHMLKDKDMLIGLKYSKRRKEYCFKIYEERK